MPEFFNSRALGLLFSQEAIAIIPDDTMVQMVTQIEDSYPSKLISPRKEVVNGCRKSLKITTPNGKMFKIILGEGPMMSRSECEDESKYEFSNASKSLVLESYINQFKPH